ncbi:MAG: non-heme iron oxygenase ferredoxin subunit [Planctomycetes bacterium]|nr:non-heme iron oxygenase ferredoxin subunit [Planctomycetota bacterium]
MAGYERIANIAEVPSGGRKPVVVDETPALLLRVGDDFYCIEDTCTHDGQAMTNGPVSRCEITCPRHGARFDIRTGAALCMPATEPIATFDVKIRDGEIYARPRNAE